MEKEPKSDEDKLLDYVEAQGAATLTFVLASADVLAKEAATTFSWLITFVGAALAFCANLILTGKPLWLSMSVGATAFHLILAARNLLRGAMLTDAIDVPGNEPKNLRQPYPLNSIRDANLDNLQERIERVRARNKVKGKAINQARKAILNAPIIFCLVAAVGAFILTVFSD